MPEDTAEDSTGTGLTGPEHDLRLCRLRFGPGLFLRSGQHGVTRRVRFRCRGPVGFIVQLNLARQAQADGMLRILNLQLDEAMMLD